jgi:hypothetical protein
MPPGYETVMASVPTPKLTEVQDMLTELDGEITTARRRDISMLIRVYLQRRGSQTAFNELLERIDASLTEIRVEVTMPADTPSVAVEEPAPSIGWGEWLRRQNPIVVLIALGMMATVADNIADRFGIDLGASDAVQEIPVEALTAEPSPAEPSPEDGPPEEVP